MTMVGEGVMYCIYPRSQIQTKLLLSSLFTNHPSPLSILHPFNTVLALTLIHITSTTKKLLETTINHGQSEDCSQ